MGMGMGRVDSACRLAQLGTDPATVHTQTRIHPLSFGSHQSMYLHRGQVADFRSQMSMHCEW